MIQNASSDERTYEGNLGGEDIQMGVANMAKLMGIVTDLYADRELACLREYSTNARDAHIAAGVDLPIRVTTPTAMAPFLTIQDFGIGMSLEDIRETYSQYGASTKTQSNDFNGMLGLGSKSALSYTDQFTVTSIKDGVRIQVVVTRTPTGANMKVVDTSSTSAPNGTTILIPAKAYNSMEAKARTFFSYWRPGTVVLNGKEPELLPGAKWLNDNLAIVDNRGSHVVMGGVPYPISVQTGLGYSKGIVAFVPIGSIDFAPSREATMDTDVTKATLAKVVQEIKLEMSAAIRRDVDAAPTRSDAIKRYSEWRKKVPAMMIPDLSHKGVDMPRMVAFPDQSVHVTPSASRLSNHSVLKSAVNNASLSIDIVSELAVVTGYDKASFTATHKKKLLRYYEEKNGDVPCYWVLVRTEPDWTWLDKSKAIKWADVNAIKLPRNAPNPTTGRIPGSYDVWEDGDLNEGIPGDDIDSSVKVFYGAQRPCYAYRDIAKHIAKSYPGSVLVGLTERRVAKFLRSFPGAIDADKFIGDEFKKWKANLNKDDVLSYALRGNLNDLEGLDPAKVDDPAIKLILRQRKRNIYSFLDEIKEWRKLGFFYNESEDIENPLDSYVLFCQYELRRNPDAVYRYLNAEYAYLASQDN